MADLKPISQFATASSVEANTLLFVSTPNQNNGYDSEKVSASELGEALVNDFMYTQDLPTVDKTITGSISEQNSVIGYSYDEYDPTTAYSTGDLCIYNNVLYKALQATTGNLPTNTTYWEPTSIADEINKLKSGFAIDSANSPNAVSVNGTYQIPANVLNHTFIIVACRRGGYGNSIMFKKDELLTFDNGFTFLGTGGGYYTLKCSNTGLLTVTNISNLSEPYILVTGLL